MYAINVCTLRANLLYGGSQLSAERSLVSGQLVMRSSDPADGEVAFCRLAVLRDTRNATFNGTIT